MNLTIHTENESFVKALQLILDPRDLHLNDSESALAETNTLSIARSVLGVVYPRNIEQLKNILSVASKYKVSLYPVSQGKNIGYGEMTPTTAAQLVVGLKYLNAIRSFDSNNGEVVVEPGVTQAQLAAFLKHQGAKFIADMTGASPEASIVGNCLEAGFGHTPLGDHRKNILQMEVLLADGTLLQTAEMPGIGPDLTQLFVQSNFGIVTAIRIPLFAVPEKIVTFTLSFASQEAFFKGISVLSALRKDGTIPSLAHTGNSVRTLMTSSRFPKNYDRLRVLSEKDCHEILNQRSPIDFGLWSSVGGFYGYADDIKNKQKRLKKALKGIAQVKFFTDSKINFLDQLLNSKLALKIKSLDFIRGSFSSLKGLHGIIRGQPSNHPSQNILWRVDQMKDLGLIWHAPVVPATEKDCSALLASARKVYADFGFEMPVTLTLIDAKHMVAVFNISYDKSNAEETARAQEAYQNLNQVTTSLGYLPYRCGLLSKSASYYTTEQYDFLQKIKSVLDPKKILAPGRYGIGGEFQN